MIDLNEYEILKNNKISLKQASLDNNNKFVENYMTNLELDVVNFDLVKDKYCKMNNIKISLNSNDALYYDENNITFIEFKNGKISKQEAIKIRGKVYDSVIILSDITTQKISYIRDNVDYILVYNKIKNQENIDSSSKKEVDFSPSLNNFTKTLSKPANKEYVAFGLNRFKNYCLKNIYTFTEEEFEDYINTKLKNLS